MTPEALARAAPVRHAAKVGFTDFSDRDYRRLYGTAIAGVWE